MVYDGAAFYDNLASTPLSQRLLVGGHFEYFIVNFQFKSPSLSDHSTLQHSKSRYTKKSAMATSGKAGRRVGEWAFSFSGVPGKA